jgi:hypothetical protein
MLSGKKYLYFARIQFLSYFLKQTSGQIPVVFDFKFSIYDKKKTLVTSIYFFEKHQNKTIILWKAPKIKQTKINHPHFDRKPPKYHDAKLSQFTLLSMNEEG